MANLDKVRRAFAEPAEFAASPLYVALCLVVAGNRSLLQLAARGRPGQVPTFLLFGAVHQLLLRGIDHPLAAYYPSIVGEQATPPTDVAPHLIAFCAAHERELTEIISTRLVQTSQVQRSLGLRFGLTTIAADGPSFVQPAHLIEVGASAGLNLRFDRYGYAVGGQLFGALDSPVQISAEYYGPTPLPDLTVLPPLASVQGVDLNPIDALDPDARSWLEALVWPENNEQRALLAAALAVVATDPPPIEAGDAIDVLPAIAAELPKGEPRIVFHAATRIHVPPARLAAFDAAIAALGEDGPLWHLAIESADPRPNPKRVGAALTLTAPNGMARTIAVVNGHLSWIEPLPGLNG